jgi:pSer/pThr/pTyr-binding forkhead associated (FHA) protein
MPGRLTLHPELGPPREWTVQEGRSYLLGRDPDCELVVDDERVSRRHARLSFADGAWTLADLDSKNGLAVAGSPIGEARLAGGEWLSLGGVLGRFEAIDDETARREASHRAGRWRSSAEHQRKLAAASGLETLLRQLLSSALEIGSGERGFVLLARGGGLEVASARGFGAGELGDTEFSGSAGAVRRALVAGRTVAVADVALDVSLAGRPSVLTGGIRALVCVPLIALGRTIGALYTDSRSPAARLEPLDVELLEAFAGHAALALEAARLGGELARLAASVPDVAAQIERDDAPVDWERELAGALERGAVRAESAGELAMPAGSAP